MEFEIFSYSRSKDIFWRCLRGSFIDFYLGLDIGYVFFLVNWFGYSGFSFVILVVGWEFKFVFISFLLLLEKEV